jgi:transcriptional regulator with XRE-family HTH domain
MPGTEELIRRVLEEKGQGPTEAAEELGVGDSTVIRWRDGLSTPSIDNIPALVRWSGRGREEISTRIKAQRERQELREVVSEALARIEILECQIQQAKEELGRAADQRRELFARLTQLADVDM